MDSQTNKQNEMPQGQPQKRSTSDNRTGFSNETEPAWAPPEHQPEPRPIEPILNPPNSNQSSKTNSPA